MELVERVNKGELIDPEQLEIYQESSNSAEKFLAHHAQAMLELRYAQQHMLQSLEAIDYSDQKVLNQFVSVSSFLGLTDLRCGPIVKFGSCAIGRREYALGLDAIQNAVTYDLTHGGEYTSDRENCLFIAQQYDRVAQCIGWAPPEPTSQTTPGVNKPIRIAYVTSGIADDETTGRTIQSLAKHLDAKRCKLTVYSTEVGVRRDRQMFAQTTYATPSAKRGSATGDVLSKLKIMPWCCSTDSDIVNCCKELASQLIKDRIDVILFDVTQADPIACTVAQWDCARVKINLCRRTPMYMGGVSCISYVDPMRYEIDKTFWARRGVDCRFILEGMDLDEILGPIPQRGTYGIPENACVLATAGNDLDETISEEFCETVINVLRSHPQAIYLLIGDGELSAQKRKFESAGVGKRIGYAGRRKDLPGFLRMTDIYLAEFPCGTGAGALQAMCMERPCVAMRCGDSAETSQAAQFVGNEACISGDDPNDYIERVSKLIREPAYRARLGKSMRTRVEQHYAYSQTARQIEQLCEQMILRPQPGETTSSRPIAQAA
jgi:predicted O-linked N-acetylglucosamine transferase (SPINDLY family)